MFDAFTRSSAMQFIIADIVTNIKCFAIQIAFGFVIGFYVGAFKTVKNC